MLLPGALVPKQTWSLEDQTWLIIMEVKMAAGCLLGNSGCLSTRNFGGISRAYLYSCSDFWEFSRHTPVPISGWIQRSCFSCWNHFGFPGSRRFGWPNLQPHGLGFWISLRLRAPVFCHCLWRQFLKHHGNPLPATCIIPILFPSIAGNFFHKFIWQRFNESSWHHIWCILKITWKKGVKCVEFLDSPTTQGTPRNSNQQPTTTSGQDANDVTTHQAAGNALPR